MLTIEPLVALLDAFDSGNLSKDDSLVLFECLVKTGLIRSMDKQYVAIAADMIARNLIKDIDFNQKLEAMVDFNEKDLEGFLQNVKDSNSFLGAIAST